MTVLAIFSRYCFPGYYLVALNLFRSPPPFFFYCFILAVPQLFLAASTNNLAFLSFYTARGVTIQAEMIEQQG